MSLENRILSIAEKMFFARGIKTVTLDEVALELGISKKTIYQFFEDKEALVYEVFSRHLKQDFAHTLQNVKESKDVIEAWVKEIAKFRDDIGKIHPTVFIEAKKLYPKVGQIIYDFKHNAIFDHLENILHQGIETGLFRADLSVKEVIVLIVSSFELPLNEDLFPRSKFNIGQVCTNINFFFLNSMLTLKGAKLFEKYKNQYL